MITPPNEPQLGGTPIGFGIGNLYRADTITDASRARSVSILNNIRRKVLFVGWGRAGKDEAAQFAEQHLGLRYGGSFSWHAKEYVAEKLGVHPMTAWETRHQNRQAWYDLCNEIRAKNITELAERCLRSGDICAGLRDKPELEAAFPLFDRVVWVERPGTPKDFTVTYTIDDVLAHPTGTWILNDGTLQKYHQELIQFFCNIGQPFPRLSDYARKLIEEMPA